MKEKTISTITTIEKIILIGILLVLLVIFANANINHYTANLDADVASETLLAQVIAENNFSTPDTWYASSERRFLEVPNLGAVIYSCTGNLNKSVGIACFIFVIFLLLAECFYSRQLRLNLLQTLMLLIVPIVMCRNIDILKIFMVYASYYVSYLVFMFCMYGVYVKWLRNGRLDFVSLVVSLVVAFCGGFQGLHPVLFTFAPVCGCEICRFIVYKLFKQKVSKKHVCILVWSTLLFVFSYIVYKLTSVFNVEGSRNIRHSLEKFIEVIVPQLFSVMGTNRMPVISWLMVIIGILGFVLVIADILIGMKKRSNTDDSAIEVDIKWGYLPIFISLFVMIIPLTFTTTESSARYFISELFIVGMGLAYFVGRIKNQIVNNIVIFCIIIYAAISCRFFYNTLIVEDNISNSTEMSVVNWMLENEVYEGYAIFDYANMLTVISNDSVHVRSINNWTDLKICKWLTDATWYQPYKEISGDVVYVNTIYSVDTFTETLEKLNIEPKEVVEIGNYVLFVLNTDLVDIYE